MSGLQTRLPCKRWPHSITQMAPMHSIKLAKTTGSRWLARRGWCSLPKRQVKTTAMNHVTYTTGTIILLPI